MLAELFAYLKCRALKFIWYSKPNIPVMCFLTCASSNADELETVYKLRRAALNLIAKLSNFLFSSFKHVV